MKKIVSIMLMLCLCLPLSIYAETEPESSKDDFLRGVWVSGVANLDYPSERGLSDSRLKAEADEIINTCIETGMNAIFLQVRPCADAFYNSSIFPKSVFLTGKSSYDELTFDPLEYFVEQAHKNNIQLHAWINPYRVTRLGEKEYAAFDPKSPQRQHPEYLLKTADGNYFFNPALQEVRDLITDGI
ncbi:MAG: glycoside hydrolase family 10 protein, partial [Clostridia bacterium]